MIKKYGLKRWVVSALLSGFALSVGAAEPVAVLEQPQGKVFVGQSKTMAPAKSGMAVYPGDRVVTAADSQVLVVYGNGCVLFLEASQLLAVRDAAQCEAGSAAGVRGVQGFAHPAIGQTPGPNGEGQEAWWLAEQTPLVALGIAAGVAAIGGIVIALDDNDDPPASPAQ